MTLSLMALLALAVTAGSVASARGATIARTHVSFGVGDQSPALFNDPRFSWLGVKAARLVVPYDVTGRSSELAVTRHWLVAARDHGVIPLVVFSQSAQRPRYLPSVGDYRDSVRRFLHLFPWVHEVVTWDEENHSTQPTARYPERAARYYMALRALCRGCAVVAADVLDESNMRSWIVRFQADAPSAHLWGLHNYYDLNRGGTRRTQLLLRLVHGDVWFTETGGLVWRAAGHSRQFVVRGEQYAARAARRLTALVAVSPRIKRIFYYHWHLPETLAQARRHPGHVTWDSGLVRPDCTARPALLVVVALLGRNPRRMPRAVRDPYGNCSAPPQR